MSCGSTAIASPVRIEDVAKDFEVTESCLTNWLARARPRRRDRAGTDELTELRELMKRNCLLELGVELVVVLCKGEPRGSACQEIEADTAFI